MLFRFAIAVTLGLGACFAPSLPSQIECSEFGECPPNRVCRAGFCVAPAADNDAAVVDGPTRAVDAGASDGRVTANCANVENLKDDFTGALSPVWEPTEENGGSISAQNGVLAVSFGLVGGNAFVTSTQRWDVENSDVYVEVVDPQSTGSSTYFALFDQFPNQTLYVGFTLEGGLLKLEATDIAAGIPEFTELDVVLFSPLMHRFWRIRHDANEVHYELSPNGVDWQSVGSFMPSMSPKDLLLALGANGLGLDGVAFDNLNGGGSPMPHDCPN